MRRDPTKRPRPGVSLPAEDNRVPELAEQPVAAAVLRHAGAWLLHGRPAGAGRIGKARPSAFRVWLPWIAPPALGAAACGVWLAGTESSALAAALLFIGAAALGGVAVVAVALAAAIAHTLPPPRRPRCEDDTLPTGAPRPPRPMTDDTPLFEYVADEVWLVERPLRFYGVEFGTRMTVLRMADGGLVLHSPVAHTPDLEAAVRLLGEPRCIVAPNALHHMFVSPWREAFPEAALLAAPRLLARRPDLAPALEWPIDPVALPFEREEIDLAAFEGHPMHQEIALFHARSGTLVLSDMLENLGHAGDALPRSAQLFLDLAMMSGRPTPPTDYKLVVDREALARSVEPMQRWKFERIVLAHGRLIEREAREVFRDAFAFTI